MVPKATRFKMQLPSHISYLVIGAGVHGLSTAYHLALELKAQGRGSGADILVVDKKDIAAGASGIACGVIRNNYFQPAMRELMAHSVAVWENDPEAFHYHAVGYIQLSPEVMRQDLAGIAAQQQEIGYTSEFIEGENACRRYMQGLFHDWSAEGITSILHEKKGGYANNKAAMHGLAEKARGQGVNILSGVAVTGFEPDSGPIRRVQTEAGPIDVDYVVIGAGPWIYPLWKMLGLPLSIRARNAEGQVRNGVPMWTFWSLQEGTLAVDPNLQRTNDDGPAPVLHVDTDAPLYSDVDGSLLTDRLWGIYFKPGFGGIQGGAMPLRVETELDQVKIDPYGPDSPDFVVGKEFARQWCSALAFCQERFRGKSHLYKDEPSGGIGAFTPDSFPVFDVFRDNCYVIADSNHGFKMIGVGKLVAQEITGRPSRLLEPFRFSRYEEGKLHPASNSPFPWS